MTGVPDRIESRPMSENPGSTEARSGDSGPAVSIRPRFGMEVHEGDAPGTIELPHAGRRPVDSLMLKISVRGTMLFVMAIGVAAYALWCRPGIVSGRNYDRIRPGMTLDRVESLLGSRGRMVGEESLPRIVDRSQPVDSPRRIKAVISGERYYRWDNDATYILVSLKGGVVHEKWFWTPSL